MNATKSAKTLGKIEVTPSDTSNGDGSKDNATGIKTANFNCFFFTLGLGSTSLSEDTGKRTK